MSQEQLEKTFKKGNVEISDPTERTLRGYGVLGEGARGEGAVSSQ